MTLVSSGSGGSNTMSNNHIYNVLNLSTLAPSSLGAVRDLDAGTYAMLFDDDSSHISFIPLTGDGSQGSPSN